MMQTNTDTNSRTITVFNIDYIAASCIVIYLLTGWELVVYIGVGLFSITTLAVGIAAYIVLMVCMFSNDPPRITRTTNIDIYNILHAIIMFSILGYFLSIGWWVPLVCYLFMMVGVFSLRLRSSPKAVDSD